MNNDQHHNDRFEELCSGYVLNALDPGERREFEQMLEDASDKQIELYHELRSAAENLAFDIDRKKPKDAVKKQLFKAIEEDLKDSQQDAGAEDTNNYKTTFAMAASFALLVITLSLVFYAFNLSSQLKNKNNIIDRQQAQLTELRNDLERKEELLAILGSREINMVIMKGMEANPNGYGKIIWDPDQQNALLQVSNLPPVPKDKEYQLWIINNNQPISAGLFAVQDSKKDAFFKIERMEAAEKPMDAFAVTLEPKGGMPQPTGDMYLMGNMNK